MSIFNRNAGKIRATKAGRVLDEAKRDVKRPKDEVKAKRDQKSGGKK